MCPLQANRKLEAFTLTEVLVTMALSSVLVIVTYMAYNMLGTYFTRVSASSQLYAERLSFRTIFSRELDLADSVKLEQQMLLMYRDAEESQWVFQDSSIQRGTAAIKMFEVGPHSMEAQSGAAGSANVPDNLISQVTVRWPDGDGDSTAFRFFKKYPISLLIN